jgi:pimeloyl-ACP methyl ester carboxylesterase
VDDAGRAPVVLLHDSLGCVEVWRDFPAQLAAATGRSVIAYDRLGYGRSDPNPALPGPDFVAAEARGDFAAVAEHFGLACFIAGGHSIGAEMSVGIGAHHGERCAGVIAMAAQTWLQEQTLDAIRAGRDQFSDAEQLQRLAKYHGDKAPWVLSAWVDVWLAPEMRDWSVLPDLARLTAPLLIVHGDSDPFSSLEQPRTMAAHTAGPARLEILPGVGHLPHREQPGRVLEVVAEWLGELG